jgi:uncharacterized protein YgiM (DUF1202 family)
MPNNNPAPTTKNLIVTAEALNLRSAPSLQGDVIDVLSEGTVIKWLDSLGDDGWRRIQVGNNTAWASHKYLQPSVASSENSPFPWLEIAHNEIGVREVVGSGDNPRIVEFHQSTRLDAPAGDVCRDNGRVSNITPNN